MRYSVYLLGTALLFAGVALWGLLHTAAEAIDCDPACRLPKPAVHSRCTCGDHCGCCAGCRK